MSLLLLSLLTITITGCGGVKELPPSEGGESTATQDEIQKQMQESMQKSGNMYQNKGTVPGQ